MSNPAGGYAPLAALRGLEKQLRLLRREWRAFRDDPSRDGLADMRRRAERVMRSLESLAGEVSDARRLEEHVLPEALLPDRPAPRMVVRTSRDLDSRVGSAARAWKEVVHTGDVRALDELIGTLSGSADQTAILLAALGSGPEAGAGGEGVQAVVHSSPNVETLSARLEAMLWRLQADWSLARQAPAEHPLRVLRESFLATASTAAELRDLRSRVGEARFKRSLRVGRHLGLGVHFLLYRDPFAGTYNREGFDALAGAELKRCRRYDRGFGLVVLRLSIPDLEGLRKAVATIRGELREYDLLARYIDDLLVVGVPEGDAPGTRRVASRILRSLRRQGIGGWVEGLAYANMPEDGSTLGGLLDGARNRLQP